MLPASPSSPNAQLERRKLGKSRKSFCSASSHEPFALNPTIGKTRGVKRTEAIYFTRKFLCSWMSLFVCKKFWRLARTDKSRAGCKSLNFFFAIQRRRFLALQMEMYANQLGWCVCWCERPSIKSDARNDTVDVTDKWWSCWWIYVRARQVNFALKMMGCSTFDGFIKTISITRLGKQISRLNSVIAVRSFMIRIELYVYFEVNVLNAVFRLFWIINNSVYWDCQTANMDWLDWIIKISWPKHWQKSRRKIKF